MSGRALPPQAPYPYVAGERAWSRTYGAIVRVVRWTEAAYGRVFTHEHDGREHRDLGHGLLPLELPVGSLVAAGPDWRSMGKLDAAVVTAVDADGMHHAKDMTPGSIGLSFSGWWKPTADRYMFWPTAYPPRCACGAFDPHPCDTSRPIQERRAWGANRLCTPATKGEHESMHDTGDYGPYRPGDVVDVVGAEHAGSGTILSRGCVPKRSLDQQLLAEGRVPLVFQPLEGGPAYYRPASLRLVQRIEWRPGDRVQHHGFVITEQEWRAYWSRIAPGQLTVVALEGRVPVRYADGTHAGIEPARLRPDKAPEVAPAPTLNVQLGDVLVCPSWPYEGMIARVTGVTASRIVATDCDGQEHELDLALAGLRKLATGERVQHKGGHTGVVVGVYMHVRASGSPLVRMCWDTSPEWERAEAVASLRRVLPPEPASSPAPAPSAAPAPGPDPQAPLPRSHVYACTLCEQPGGMIRWANGDEAPAHRGPCNVIQPCGHRDTRMWEWYDTAAHRWAAGCGACYAAGMADDE